MRALFISTSVPPFAESQSIRNVFLLRGLNNSGWDVDVIAPQVIGGDESLLRLIPAQVQIHRAGISPYDLLQRGIARIPMRWARNTLKGVCARAAGAVLAPDVRRGWERQAIRVAQEIGSADRFDLIISSAGSNTAHLAASVLAHQWSRPWIAEYGDPWSLNPLPPASHWHIRTVNSRMERSALRYCSGISVTTQSTASAMQKWLGNVCPPIEVIPCGFSMEGPHPRQCSPGKGTVVSYIGTASRGSRDLRRIMRALDKAAHEGKETVTFQMVGSVSPSFEKKGKELQHLKVESRGWVPYEESLQLMGRSDLLLLVGNAQPLQVPAKVFNYLASGRPVLYYGQVRPDMDETHAILSRLPGVVILNSEEGPLEHQLGAALGQKQELLDASAHRMEQAWIRDYAWDRIGANFGAFANRIYSGEQEAQ
jgi:hypothetical protein